MNAYKYLPHTADVKFRASGKTLNEAFKNAAYALTDVITNHKKIKSTVKKTIKITSENKEALLYDFLEQFLILVDSKNFLLNKIIILKIEEVKKGFKLTAKIAGDNHPKKYKINMQIKAVTYQEMFIKKQKGKFILQVVLDI